MPPTDQNAPPEARFATVFGHLAAVTAYARRRGCRDPEGIAAEAMAIAWRRLADVPRDDPRPWLFATARNLVLADARTRRRNAVEDRSDRSALDDRRADDPFAAVCELDPDLATALRRLSATDREALLLVAWDDLSPALAAEALGISAVAFRVRLHRARRRCARALAAPTAAATPALSLTPEKP